MRTSKVQSQTLSVCLVLTAATLFAGALTGRSSAAMGIAVGVAMGAFNGFTFQAVLDRGAPILPTSVLRLAFFSLLAIGAARLIAVPVWPVVAGVGVAQLVMGAVGARQGLRA